jgi:hypothetical protein
MILYSRIFGPIFIFIFKKGYECRKCVISDSIAWDDARNSDHPSRITGGPGADHV